MHNQGDICHRCCLGLFFFKLPTNLLKIPFPTFPCLTGRDNGKHITSFILYKWESKHWLIFYMWLESSQNNTEDVSHCDACLQKMITLHKVTWALLADTTLEESPFVDTMRSDECTCCSYWSVDYHKTGNFWSFMMGWFPNMLWEKIKSTSVVSLRRLGALYSL